LIIILKQSKWKEKWSMVLNAKFILLLVCMHVIGLLYVGNELIGVITKQQQMDTYAIEQFSGNVYKTTNVAHLKGE